MSTRCVLFLCTGNSARSQMAEGWVNALLPGRWEAHSAGTRPTGQVHRLAVWAMSEVGIDLSHHRSKHVDQMRGLGFDLIVTVCDNAARDCPAWLGSGRVMHIAFPDPAAAAGTEDERLAVFRAVRDDVRRQILAYLKEAEDELESTGKT